jgi:endo-1,4-beta-xylanase
LNRRRLLKYAGATAVAVGFSALGLNQYLKTNSNPTIQTSASVSTTELSSISSSVTSTSSVTSSTTPSPPCYPANSSSLRSVAESCGGLLVGAAAEYEHLFKKGTLVMNYANTLGSQFNFLTPGNAMKWGPIDENGLDPADAIVDFASRNKMKIKGHTLVWHEQLPAWVNVQMSTDQLRAAVQDHIRSLVGHFKGRVFAWDVVNEAIEWSDASGSWGLRDTVFLEKLGEGYIGDAFRLAHETDPDALLIYNDYGAEGLCGKSDRVYELVRSLLADGVPIHGVGLQMHISATDYPDPDGITANVRRLTDLGLKVNISEMDVRIHDAPGTMKDKLELQRRVYHDVIAACVKVRGFMGVTFWGFTDAVSWITNGSAEPYFPRDDAPLLFDANYNPKPAYFGVVDALQGK